MKYPLGHQDFRLIRERGLVYVDKTREVCALADLRTYLFLARPRRFGKSLTVNTLKELYSGDRELFRGLWAYDNWDFGDRRATVLRFEFASSGFAVAGIDTALHNLITTNAERLGLAVPDEGADYATRFSALLKAAAAASPSGKAVLLVDEYDKPITQHIEGGAGGALDPGIDDTLRALKAFYGVLKDADHLLELVFITGVSAFSKVSLFSDLNNLHNLSLRAEAATVVGITEDELGRYFADDIAATGVAREEVRRWYNGYRFATGAERVYNPWSVLSFLVAGQLDNYWYETGTPRWLLDYLVRQPEFALDDLTIASVVLNSFDIYHLDVVPLLFQTGYLTIVEYLPGPRAYRLDYPNSEVREAFGMAILDAVAAEAPRSTTSGRALRAESALQSGDVAGFLCEVDAMLSSIPYPLWEARRESAYHIVAHTLLTVIDVRAHSESTSARGRADTIVETSSFVYAFEFKVDRPAQEAVAQVLERGYLDAFRGDGRALVAVGVSFDTAKRRVGEWVERRVG